MHYRSTLVRPFFMGVFSFMTASLSVHAIPILNDFVTAYTQDFNTLATSGLSDSLPTGWRMAESGTGANSVYGASTGSSTGGDVYSFGLAGSGERALGGLQTGTVIPTFGVQLVNGTGQDVNSLLVSFTGEQWRLGASGRADRLDFQYSLDALSLTTGTWSDFNALDFVSPQTGITGAMNGNDAANQQALSALIDGFTLANDSIIWLRWTDFNASGSDDGLAIDDISVQAITVIPSPVPENGATLWLLGASFLPVLLWRRDFRPTAT